MIKFIWRIASAHTIAYFIAGLFAITFLNYDELFNVGDLSFMRSTDSPWVAAGPGLQIVKGIVLGLVLYSFRAIFLETKYGWFKFGVLLFGLSYVLTLSAAVGSFEGLIYTNIPLKTHLNGLSEVVLYTLLFSVILWLWYRKESKLINILSIVLTAIIVFLSIMGVLAATGLVEVN